MGYDAETGWDDTNVDRAALEADREAKKGEKKAYIGMTKDGKYDTIVATFTIDPKNKEAQEAEIQKKVIDVYKNDADVKIAKERFGGLVMSVIIKDKIAKDA